MCNTWSKFKSWLTQQPIRRSYNPTYGYWFLPGEDPHAVGLKVGVTTRSRPDIESAPGELWVTVNDSADEQGEILNVVLSHLMGFQEPVLEPVRATVIATGMTSLFWQATTTGIDGDGDFDIEKEYEKIVGSWVFVPQEGPKDMREAIDLRAHGGTFNWLMGHPNAQVNSGLLRLLETYDLLEVTVTNGELEGVGHLFSAENVFVFDVRHFKAARALLEPTPVSMTDE